MDEVIKKFESSLAPVSDKESEFEGLYKNWGKFGNQEERRRELLETQKSNRNNNLDNYRGILEIVQSFEYQNASRVGYRPSIYVSGFNKKPMSYRKILMLSEWMIEKPVDFNHNWYVVPCPKGTRLLVVSYEGLTKCYTKYGHFRFQGSSALPGGNRRDLRKNKCCVLDCFYDERNRTMHVLDILAWNSQPMTDGETEFRHYWLTTQLEDIPELLVQSKTNNFIFKIIPKVPCEDKSFRDFMKSFPHFPQNTPPVDGLLFYHKHARYYGGPTPLVGWLYPFMVPEVLGSDIELHEVYKLDVPKQYVNQKDYIEQFEEKMAKKQDKITGHRGKLNNMDTTEPETEEASESGNGESMAEDASALEIDNMESENIETVRTEVVQEQKAQGESEVTKIAEEAKFVLGTEDISALERDNMESENIETVKTEVVQEQQAEGKPEVKKIAEEAKLESDKTKVTEKMD